MTQNKSTNIRERFIAAAESNGGRYKKYSVHGYQIFLNISESIMMYARAIERFEPAKFAFLKRYLKPGMGFVDVGANKGDFSLLAAKHVGPTGRVIAFEPEPENCAWMRKSIGANGFTNIVLMQKALSNRTGTANLYLGKKSGWHTLKPEQENRNEGVITISTCELDNVLEGRCDVLKIDVEGAENEVIDGAAETIKLHRPAILLDLHPQLGADVADIQRKLLDQSYLAFDMMDLGAPLQRLPNAPVDVLFFPAERRSR